MKQHDHDRGDRGGAQQPHRFDPAKAERLDDPAREEWLPRAHVFALLDAPQNAIVVDFGAGTGTFAVPLANEQFDLTVYALDEQPEMLAIVRERATAGGVANLLSVMPDALDELAGKADRVLAVAVLHELGDRSLADLAALLKPDGMALVVDWNAAVERPVGPPRDHVYTREEAAARLATVGLASEVVGDFPYHYALRVTRAGRPQAPGFGNGN